MPDASTAEVSHLGTTNRPLHLDTAHRAVPAAVDEVVWRRRLLDLASRQLLGDEPVSFNTVVRAMAGADPVLVRSLLGELIHTGSPRLNARALAAVADSGRAVPGPTITADPRLPAPHPLDYEWRFAPRTRDHLVATVLASAPRSVLLLGCPTIALVLLSHRPDLHITLVDDNPALPLLSDVVEGGSATYRQLRADLIAAPEVTAGVRADIVIADAPFYPDAMAGFLYAAVTGARRGARLMFALPPFGSRPSAEVDVRSFVRLAATSGLRHLATTPNGVRYLRPPFEAKAHRSAGLLSLAEDWRAADLAVFRLARSTGLATTVPALSERNRWQEMVVGGKRWRVKTDRGTSPVVEGLLQSVASDTVLDTVSRRDERRHGANVCTEDNEFFVTANPLLFLQVLDSVVARRDPVTQMEKYLGRTLSPTEYTEVSLVLDLIRRGSPTAIDVG